MALSHGIRRNILSQHRWVAVRIELVQAAYLAAQTEIVT